MTKYSEPSALNVGWKSVKFGSLNNALLDYTTRGLFRQAWG